MSYRVKTLNPKDKKLIALSMNESLDTDLLEMFGINPVKDVKKFVDTLDLVAINKIKDDSDKNISIKRELTKAGFDSSSASVNKVKAEIATRK